MTKSDKSGDPLADWDAEDVWTCVTCDWKHTGRRHSYDEPQWRLHPDTEISEGISPRFCSLECKQEYMRLELYK